MTSEDDRYAEIATGIERIRKEKPYDDEGDAIAALDWLNSAIGDVRKALNGSDDIGDIARLQQWLDPLESLHSSVVGGMKRKDTKVPERHLAPSTDVDS